MLPVGIEGLQRAFKLTWFWVTALTWFHSIPLSFMIFCIRSPKICWSLPLDIFPCVLISMSFLQCDQTTSVVLYVRGTISNSILVVWFLILSFSLTLFLYCFIPRIKLDFLLLKKPTTCTHKAYTIRTINFSCYMFWRSSTIIWE